jgi:hypothetical protein
VRPCTPATSRWNSPGLRVGGFFGGRYEVAKCFHCGAETPEALRHPGLYSQLPANKRGRLPYCPAHMADAFARRDAAIGATLTRGDSAASGQGQPTQRQKRSSGGKTSHNPEQGQLI